MSSSLGTLTLDLIAEIKEFKQGMDKASRIAEQNSREIQCSIRDIERRIQRMSRVVASVAGVFGATLTVSAFNNWIKGSLESAQNTGIFAEKIGLTVEELTTFRYIAGQAGASVQELDSSMLRLNSRLGAAVSGGGPAASTLKRLGLNAKELLSLPLEERILAISKAMEGLTRGEQLRALQNMAGDSARSLIKIFDMSQKEIQELSANARKLGYVYSTEMARNADTVLTQIGEIKGAFSNLSLQIINEFLPDVEKFFSSITADDIKESTKVVKSVIEDAGTAVKALSIAFGLKLVGSVSASTVAFGINTVAKTVNIATTLKLEGASSRAALAIAAQTMAVRGLSVAYSALGGPLGLLLLTAGSFAFLKKKQLEAKKSTDELTESIGDLTVGIEKLSIEEARYKRDNLETRIREAKDREASIRQELKEIESQREFIEKRGYKKLSIWGKETLDIEKNAEELEKLRKKKNELEFEQKKLNNSIRAGEEAFKSYDDVINRVVRNMGDLASESDAVKNKLDEVISKIKDDTARLSLKTEVEIFRHEWNNTTKWDEYKVGSEEEQKEIKAKIEAAYAEFDNKKRIVNQASQKGIDLAKEYQRIMESTLSDEERRGLELQKNLEILRQYGASEADMLAVRRAAYESMSVDLPGYDGSGDTLTAQLARINENIAELDQWREEQLQKIQQAYGDEESALAESIARKEEIERAYRERRSQYEGELNQELLNMAQSLSSETLSVLETAGLEASGIYKALFLANKAAAFANAIVSAQVAGVKAMEAYSSINPGMAMAMGKMITGVGMVNAGIIAGTALRGFATGGYTGHGGKYEPAGIVHAGEVVFSQDDIRRLGGVQVVESIRTGKLPGFKEGGIVGLGSVNIPDRTFQSLNHFSPEINITVHVSEDGTADAEAYDGLGKKIDERIKVTVKREIATAQRPGGVLARR
ncbi:hypothetical protein B9T19_03750 [Ignatzschineria sp. F8392]|uniref:hypothetical protein n=1 Tax=Ignatzschineria sp. F8392 TaxID=1980117 RepID=UPI000B97F783|nr:hypothetical protein [Ignatzschineria sp. F8392]OYQ81786.1 hypothetical protein B9T19_03750 [Ignatzschineria sp. F8392]